LGILTDPIIEAYKKEMDRASIGEDLRLTVEQGLEEHMRWQEFAERLQRAGQQTAERCSAASSN
jgi:hypothetical protein